MLQRMDSRLAEPFLVGFADSMDLVFLVAACVVAIGFVLIWFMREVPLRTQSGIQARDTEKAGTPAPAADVALDVPASAPPVPAGAAAEPGGGARRARYARRPARRPGSRDHGPRPRHRTTGGPVAAEDEVIVSLHGLDGAPVERTEPDAAGGFVLRAPASGTYVLIASSPRRRPFAELVTVDGVPVRRDVALASAATLAGRVTEPDGTPVAGATMTVTDLMGSVVGVHRSDADGSGRAARSRPAATR